jgi:hypothetical protein
VRKIAGNLNILVIAISSNALITLKTIFFSQCLGVEIERPALLRSRTSHLLSSAS